METLQRTANRGSISTGYDIDNSLKIEEDNAEHMTRTYSEAGVKTKGTISFWHKRSEIQSGIKRPVDCTDGSGENSSGIFIDGHRLCFDFGGGGRRSLRANALMRDTSAWYHLMATWDTSQGTASNRAKIYINGEQVTDLHEATYPDENMASQFFTNTGGASQANKLFCQATNTSNHPSGYFAEFNYVNNAQLTPSDFGEYDNSGIWKPKKYTGSYGDTGFYLDFADAADLGDDESGNGNDWTEVNITAADQATDTPTNNFCTLNPLSAGGNRGNVISEGATKVVIENNGQQVAVGTIAVTTGKWYWEAKHTSGTYQFAGIISADSRVSGNGGVAGSSVAGSDAIALYRVDGKVFYNSDTGTSFDTDTYTNGDIIGVALDMDNGTCALYKNNSIMGNVSGTDIVARSGHASLTGAWTAMYSDGTNGVFNITYEVNFGGYTSFSISSAATDENGYGTFEYAPPSGYYALCTKNLAEYG